MRLTRPGIVVGMAAIAGFAIGSLALAVVTPAQKAKLAAAEGDVAAAEGLVKSRQLKDAVAPMTKAHATLSALVASGDPAVIAAVEPLKTRLTDLQTTLSLEGVAVPSMKLDPAAPKPGTKPAAKPKTLAKPTKPTAKTPNAKTPAKPADGKASFVRDVAPMLVAKCGRCHIDDAKGKFSTATFAGLQKGSEGGVVFTPRRSKGSRIIDVIESGDMPRGGNKVSPAELTALAKWIDEGAMFDGPNANTPLKQLAGNAAAPKEKEMMKLEVVAATGRETTSYSRDVASVFVSQCINCHGMQNPRGNLSFTDFQRFLNGGTSGAAIVPGKPAESLLIKKLKGQAGAQDAASAAALPADVIAKIEKWVEEGARFDGPGAQSPTEQVVAFYNAKHSTHEELLAKRVKQAQLNWRLAVPGEQDKPTVHDTDGFLLLGNVAAEDLKFVAEAAQKQAGKVAQTLKVPTDKPLIKGRMTLFVFTRRYDYAEFGQMVEKRQLPSGWLGHWKFDTIDAYGAMAFARNDDYPLDGMLAQQIAGAYVASQGAIPRWFAEGAGRAVAASIDSRDKRVKAWDGMISQIAAGAPQPDALLGNSLPPEEADILAYGFVRDLKVTNRNFTKLLELTRSGVAFDRAFAQIYRATPNQAAANYTRRVAGRRR